MNIQTRILFFITFTMALMFGFMHLIVPEHNFERLHIFLFNLCSGGSIIIYFTEDKHKMSLKNKIFFLLTFLYAFLSYFRQYLLAIIISLILVIIVESVRIKKFSFFPGDFFTTKVPTFDKFHHASLLCLSLALLLSTFAIFNHEYVKLLPFEKFELNTFFLGFSFPVSLITLSMVFKMMHRAKSMMGRYTKITIFWVINLGVIIFFIFILFESAILELVISLILVVAVLTTLVLYINLGIKEQQKAFLTSGICFLIATAITGVAYILVYFYPEYNTAENLKFLRNIHRIVSLYGWNLSGLVVISRINDFPIRLHSGKIIFLHWITVFLLAPMGYYNLAFAFLAVVSYVIFLYFVFFSSCEEKECKIDYGTVSGS
ncbi:MAG: hypothetical protein PWQ25_72 [Deferribacteres bacterium]|jgi:hypothetical protein|nr:hypothetical protein [Deferribacteres bacterium]